LAGSTTAHLQSPISAPTLVIWGRAIPTSAPISPSPSATMSPTSTAWSAWADASHWVHHDEAERVNELLIDFFAPAA
jgi:epoxide hydrolase 4